MSLDAQAGLATLDELLKRQDELLKEMKRDSAVAGSVSVGLDDLYFAAPLSSAPEDFKDIESMISHLEVSQNNARSREIGAAPEPDVSSPEPSTDKRSEKDGNAYARASRVLRDLRGSKKRWISGGVFYLVLVVILIGAMSFMGGNDTPHTILGYSTASILTGSMQREIPQGSLVLTRKVPANSLQVGDDITYMYSATTSVTHKIVAIYENYDRTRERGFQTQGVENPVPDKDIVPADNVVGKVIWHVSVVGAVMRFVSHNIVLVMGSLAGLGVLLYLLYLALRWMLSADTTSTPAPGTSLQEGNSNPSPQLFPSCRAVPRRIRVARMQT